MEYHCIPINQNHADLPKFQGPHDCEYRLLSVYLNQVWKEAAGNVQLRFCTIGMHNVGFLYFLVFDLGHPWVKDV